jgi:hypothetical protein
MVAQFIETLRYMLEGHGFQSRSGTSIFQLVLVRTDDPKKRIVSIIKVLRIGELGTLAFFIVMKTSNLTQ